MYVLNQTTYYMHEFVTAAFNSCMSAATNCIYPPPTRACNISSDLIHISNHIHTTHIIYTIIYKLILYILLYIYISSIIIWVLGSRGRTLHAHK